MAVSQSTYEFLSLRLGLGPATVRTQYLGVMRSDESPSFTASALHLGANALGVGLLDASDAADLEIRIDDALDNPNLSRVLGLIADEVTQVPSLGSLPAFQDVLPVDQAKRVEEVVPIFAEIRRLQQELRTAFPTSRPSERLAAEPLTLLQQLYQPFVSPTVARLTLTALRGTRPFWAL